MIVFKFGRIIFVYFTNDWAFYSKEMLNDKNGIGGNNMAKFVDYQILPNILKLKCNENISVISSIDILLIVMESAVFVWHRSPYPNLNTTCVLRMYSLIILLAN